MNVQLRVTGYDKLTERVGARHEIPAYAVEDALALAKVGPEDDGLGSYPLEGQAARALGLKMDNPLNPDLYDWFLEPR